MTSGAPKTPKMKAQQAPGAFTGVHTSTFGSDFGSGTSSINPATGEINTTSALAAPQKAAADTANTGLQSNLSYLQQDPTQRYSSIAAGEDPYYNAMNIQNQRLTDQALARAKVDGQAGGNDNSTLLGGELGRIHNDDLLRQESNMSNAYTLGNQTATSNANTNLGAETGLANLVYPLASGANSNLMSALSSQDQENQFNAQQKASAQSANVQNEIAAQQRQAAGTGSLINAGITGAGLVLGGPVGGAVAGGLASYFNPTQQVTPNAPSGALGQASNSPYLSQPTFGSNLGAGGYSGYPYSSAAGIGSSFPSTVMGVY